MNKSYDPFYMNAVLERITADGETFDIADAIWCDQHAYRLGQHVGSIRDVEMLRHIAEMTGFKP